MHDSFDSPGEDRCELPRFISRRSVIGILAGLGIGTAAFQRALALQAEQAGNVTPELIQQAEWIAGIELSDEDRKAITGSVERDLKRYESLRSVELTNSVPPALAFFAAPPQGAEVDVRRGEVRPIQTAALPRPAGEDDLAFLPVTALAALIRSRQVTS